MAKRGVMTSWLLGSLSLIALLLFAALEPWRGPDDGELRLENVAPTGGLLARNETLTLNFDRPLHPETPLEALIQVRDEAESRIEIEIERLGESVLLRPSDELGWPALQEIEVVVSPGIAVPFRARDLSVLRRRIARHFRIGEHYIDYGRDLELELVAPATLVSVPLGTSFRFRAGLPLARASLSEEEPPVTLIVGEPDARRALIPKVEILDDGRTLLVSPWEGPEDFSTGMPHRLIVRRGRLRSVTGRSLERDLTIDFRSALDRAFEGQIDLSFALSDLDPESVPYEVDMRGAARPFTSLFSSVELGVKVEQNLQTMILDLPFAPRPRRLQILVPGEILGEEPGLVTGFSFFAAPDPLDVDTVLHRDIVLPRVVFRLGETPAPGAFGDDGDRNFAAPGPFNTVALGSRDGELVLHRQRSGSRYGGWIEIEFDRPYVHRGGNRDLVLEVVNDAGAFAADGTELSTAWPGPIWVSSRSPNANPEGRPRSLVITDRLGSKSRGEATNHVFATRIHIQRYQDLVTRWYEAEVENPLWFRVAAEGQLDAEGVEGRDFQLEFQGLDAEGRESPWGRLESLSGCRRIRARLRFLPGFDRRAIEPRVRRLRLKYRDGR